MAKLFSMTGHATRIWEALEGRYHLEARSVNHRYIEVKIRLPYRYDAWEPAISKLVKGGFSRGRFDISITEVPGEVSRGSVHVDSDLAVKYAHALKSIKDSLDLTGDITIDMISRMRDVVTIGDRGGDADIAWGKFSPVFSGVLSDLEMERKREGDALGKDIVDRVLKVKEIIERIEGGKPKALSFFRERLRSRIAELLEHEVDPGRIEQEVVFLAERSDITEEIVRMKSHIAGFLDAIGAGSPVGRKLDFYLQEMGREVNTIGNKICRDDRIWLKVVSGNHVDDLFLICVHIGKYQVLGISDNVQLFGRDHLAALNTLNHDYHIDCRLGWNRSCFTRYCFCSITLGE